MAKTAAEMATMYQDAIESIVAGDVSGYTVMGQTFTMHDIEKLERLREYWDRKVTEDSHGVRSVVDVRPS